MKPALLIFTLLLSITLFAQEDKPIEVPQIAVKVKLAEKTDFDGVSIVLKEVLEDSRCPKNVECVWAGQAKIRVGILTDDGEEIEKTITFSNGRTVIAGIFDDKELQFLKLTPYPDANVSVADRAPYALLVRTVQQ